MTKQHLIRLFLNVIILSCAQTIYGSTLASLKKAEIQNERYPYITSKISNTKSTTIVECSYGGEYSVNDFIKPGTYIIASDKSCSITFTDNENGIIGSGKGNLIVSITTAGKYRIHVSLNKPASNGRDEKCHRITVAPVFIKAESNDVVDEFVSTSSVYNRTIIETKMQHKSKSKITLAANDDMLIHRNTTIQRNKVKEISDNVSSKLIASTKSILTSSEIGSIGIHKLKGKLQDPFSQTGRVKNILAYMLARKSRIAVSEINTT